MKSCPRSEQFIFGLHVERMFAVCIELNDVITHLSVFASPKGQQLTRGNNSQGTFAYLWTSFLLLPVLGSSFLKVVPSRTVALEYKQAAAVPAQMTPPPEMANSVTLEAECVYTMSPEALGCGPRTTLQTSQL